MEILCTSVWEIFQTSNILNIVQSNEAHIVIDNFLDSLDIKDILGKIQQEHPSASAITVWRIAPGVSPIPLLGFLHSYELNVQIKIHHNDDKNCYICGNLDTCFNISGQLSDNLFPTCPSCIGKAQRPISIAVAVN